MDKRSIVSSSIGNILEWYDFGLFAIYSPLLATLFFPRSDAKVQLLATLSIFAVGFLCRPIGALIFGCLGDKQGRVKTLRLSILMICLPTLLIGCLPTYSQWGVWASVLLCLTRIWQGISLGGEYSGTLIYIAESAPVKQRATLTSLAPTGANLGILLATVVGSLCKNLFTVTFFQSLGWRIPYLLSGLLSLLIYHIRLNMTETHVFTELQDKQLIANHPIRLTLKNNIPAILRTLGLICMGSTFYYFSFIFIPMFIDSYSSFPLLKTGLMSFLFVVMLILVPRAGALCDKLGRRKMLLFNAGMMALIVVPAYYFLQNNIFGFIIALLIFTILSSLEQATTCVAVVENYPTPARYTGLSLSYNLGNGIFAGTIPLICTGLTAQNHLSLAPAIYIALCAMVTLIVVFFFVPETKETSLI